MRPEGLEEVGERDTEDLVARSSHANDNERLYELLVLAGRRGGSKNTAEKIANVEARRLNKNKKARERKQEMKKVNKSSQRAEETQSAKAEARVEFATESLPEEQTENYQEVIRNFTSE